MACRCSLSYIAAPHDLFFVRSNHHTIACSKTNYLTGNNILMSIGHKLFDMVLLKQRQDYGELAH